MDNMQVQELLDIAAAPLTADEVAYWKRVEAIEAANREGFSDEVLEILDTDYSVTPAISSAELLEQLEAADADAKL